MGDTKALLFWLVILIEICGFPSGALLTEADRAVTVAGRSAEASSHEATESGPPAREPWVNDSSSSCLSVDRLEQNSLLEEGHEPTHRSKSQSDDEDFQGTSVDRKLVAFESRQLSGVINNYERNLGRGLRMLELRHPNPATRPGPTALAPDQKAIMAVVIEDATNGLRYAAEVIQSVTNRKWGRAQKVVVKARLALRSAMNIQHQWVESGYYIRLYEEDAGYRIQWRAYLEQNINRDLEAFRSSNVALVDGIDNERIKELTHELMMMMLQVYREADAFHNRLATSQTIEDSECDISGYLFDKQGEQKAVKRVIEEAVSSLRLQGQAIKELQAKKRVRAYEILADARRSLDDLHQAYAHETLSQGYKDRVILSDPNYRIQRRTLKALIERLNERDDLDWESQNVDQARKYEQVNRQLGYWFQADQEFTRKIELASKIDKNIEINSNKAEEYEKGMRKVLWREPNTVFQSLVRKRVSQCQSVVNGYRAFRRIDYQQGAKELKKALHAQQALHVMRLNRVVKGLPDLNLILDPEFQNLEKKEKEIKHELIRQGLSFSESSPDAFKRVIMELNVILSSMKDVNIILKDDSFKDPSTKFHEFPRLLMTEPKKMEIQESEDELKATKAKVQEGIELIMKAFEKLPQSDLEGAMQLAQKASRTQEQADRLRIQRVLNGLSDKTIVQDLKYKGILLSLQRKHDLWRNFLQDKSNFW